MLRFFLTVTLGSLLLISPLSFARTELPPLDFEIIPIHSGLLKERAYIWQEYEGLTNFTLENDAVAGDKILNLSEPAHFNELELIVYQSASGQFYVTQVVTVKDKTITLLEPLKDDVNKGNFLWNFYHDASHPNKAGYKALADFALRRLDLELLENKVHAFIGDSWLASKFLEKRIRHQINLTAGFNKAVHGRKSIDVLKSFDEDFKDNQFVPDYVWITLGTNDYWLDVSAEDYIKNIEAIIRKANNLGAKVIIFDSSVGPLEWDSVTNSFKTVRKDLSNAYSKNLAELYKKNQAIPIDDSSGGGSVFVFELVVLLSFLVVRRSNTSGFKYYSSSIA